MKRYIAISLVCWSIVSCTDKLDQQNPNLQTETNFWQTDEDFLAGLAATYKVFKNSDQGYYAIRGIQLSNARGDDFFFRNDVQALYQVATFTNNPTTGLVGGLFAGCYSGIFRANQIIEKAPGAPISAASREQFIAEAKFIRALNYFHLAINFGDVPIITTVPKDRDDYFVKQSPEAEVWAQVIADFQDAKNGLPVSYPAEWVGRATKGAAIGFLGKAYLYTNQWAEAEAEFSLLTDANGMAKNPFTYNLLTNYEDNFLKEKDNNEESLFEIQLQHVGGTNTGSAENANESQGTRTANSFAPSEVGGYFGPFPTNKIFEEFQKEKTVDGDFDPRMYASIVWDYPGAMYYNRPYTSFAELFGFKSRIRKYQNWRDDNEGIQISEINEKALRYADILLMYAEALTMQDRHGEAYPLVNRIRTRAHLAPLPTGYTKEQVLAEIRHQRMIEFFRENLRFYDLKRWGLLQQEITNSDKEGRQFFNPQLHQYFPIPQGEINANPNIDQRPEWR